MWFRPRKFCHGGPPGDNVFLAINIFYRGLYRPPSGSRWTHSSFEIGPNCFVRGVCTKISKEITCADQESFFRGGPTLTMFSFRWWVDLNTTKIGPSSACQRNKMVNCWCAKDGPTLNAGLEALWFFRGPPIPPLDPRMVQAYTIHQGLQCL